MLIKDAARKRISGRISVRFTVSIKRGKEISGFFKIALDAGQKVNRCSGGSGFPGSCSI